MTQLAGESSAKPTPEPAARWPVGDGNHFCFNDYRAREAGPENRRAMCLFEYSNGGIVTTRLDELLRAAGDSIRLRILNLLREGRVCVCDLQRVLGHPQPTVSRHLAVLRHAGLVDDTRNGNRVLYSLAPADSPQMAAFFHFLRRCSCHEETMQNDSRLLEALHRQGQCAVGGVRNTTERDGP
jgi:ArsR family transcriptional regulator